MRILSIYHSNAFDVSNEWMLWVRVGITLAYAHEEHLYFHHPSFLESLLEPIDSPRGPHRALLEAMYLVACYYTSVKFPNPTSPYSLERLEQHFLIRARKAQNDSLAWGDRLMDWLKGACLVTSYFTKKGRYLEGYVGRHLYGSNFD